MADINDISTVVASALIELSVNGELDVAMEGQKRVVPLGEQGDEVLVTMTVEPAVHANS